MFPTRDGEAGGLGRDAAAPAGDADRAGAVRDAVPGERRRALWPGVKRLARPVPPAGFGEPAAGAVPGGGRGASGPRPADGGALGATGGAADHRGFGFDRAVPAGGYAWWYVDAVSDDGEHALTLIAFIGSVFSPYYARALRRGPAAAENHVSMNVAFVPAEPLGDDRAARRRAQAAAGASADRPEPAGLGRRGADGGDCRDRRAAAAAAARADPSDPGADRKPGLSAGRGRPAPLAPDRAAGAGSRWRSTGLR